ncbi:unnamed protein product, partial [Didymodactylos carnosus]
RRMPFLMSTLEHFYQQYKTTFINNDNRSNSQQQQQHDLLINEMFSSTGSSTIIDSTLCQALINQKQSTALQSTTPIGNIESDDYVLSCLIMVYIAVSIPRLAKLESTKYIPALNAHTNNSHCITKAINTLITTFFLEYGQTNIEERCKEFLALASSSLLRLIDVDCSTGSSSHHHHHHHHRNSSSTTNNSDIIHKEATYILLDQFVGDVFT